MSPFVVFIHGGYWQALDRSFFSHMAAGCNAHGVDVAIPSYRLAPEVGIADIIEICRRFACTCGSRTGGSWWCAGTRRAGTWRRA